MICEWPWCNKGNPLLGVLQEGQRSLTILDLRHFLRDLTDDLTHTSMN